MPKYSKHYYNKFIAKSKKDELIETLLENLSLYLASHADATIQRIYKALIIQSGRWESLKQTKTLGIGDDRDNTTKENQISNGILSSIDTLPQYFFDFMNGDKPPKPAPTPDVRDQILDIRKKATFEYDAFFSFSSIDIEEAKAICDELRGYGLKVFLSAEALKANTGKSYSERIDYALENSKHFFLLSSKNAMVSEWVKIEYETFFNEYHIKNRGERRFIFIKGQGFSMAAVPKLYRRLQFANHPREILDTLINDESFANHPKEILDTLINDESFKQKREKEQEEKQEKERQRLALLAQEKEQEAKRQAAIKEQEEKEELERQALAELQERKRLKKEREEAEKAEEEKLLKEEQQKKAEEEKERQRLALLAQEKEQEAKRQAALKAQQEKAELERQALAELQERKRLKKEREEAEKAAEEKRLKEQRKKETAERRALFLKNNGWKIGVGFVSLLLLVFMYKMCDFPTSPIVIKDDVVNTDSLEQVKKDSLAKIQRKKDAAKKQQVEKEYAKLLKEAQNLYDSKNYAEAKTKYTAAISAADGLVDTKDAEAGKKEAEDKLALKIACSTEERIDKKGSKTYLNVDCFVAATSDEKFTSVEDCFKAIANFALVSLNSTTKSELTEFIKKENPTSYKKIDSYIREKKTQSGDSWKNAIKGGTSFIIWKDEMASSIPEKKDVIIPERKPKTKTSNNNILASIESNMISISGGTFTMGCKDGRDSDCEDDEKPPHSVTVSSFKMSKYEVTQEQWREVMGTSPSNNKNCDKCPVEKVSWNDTQDFLKKLNQKTGKNYRLPTEAEWEYAARGGENYQYAGSNTIGNVAWYEDNSSSKTHPVRGKSPNGYGLYDMTGNVWEWCQDWYKGYPGSSGVKDYTGSSRVLRGGGWYGIARDCRVSNRHYFDPSSRFLKGFRVVSSQ